MSFLSQLKEKANAIQAEKSAAQTQAQIDTEKNILRTEAACKATWNYLSEMVRQLNVLVPRGPQFTVDGKTPWPVMKLVDFRADSRKKMLGKREVYATIGVGWDILPQEGKPVTQKVIVDFMPELQKVEGRLQAGNVQHERDMVRHPQKNSVQAIQFEYRTLASGSITVTPNHESGTLSFRFCNVSGLAVQSGTWNSGVVDSAFLDELAKLLMSQPSRLFPG